MKIIQPVKVRQLVNMRPTRSASCNKPVRWLKHHDLLSDLVFQGQTRLPAKTRESHGASLWHPKKSFAALVSAQSELIIFAQLQPSTPCLHEALSAQCREQGVGPKGQNDQAPHDMESNMLTMSKSKRAWVLCLGKAMKSSSWAWMEWWAS